MIEATIAPGLLLAMPQLDDPNFSRAVVLMIEHGDEGSFGLILNHPSTLSVAELLESLELTWQGDPSHVVWSGGPVMPTSGWVLHSPVADLPIGDESERGTVAITDDITLSASTTALAAIAAHPPQQSRFLLGYAGWGPGQLAVEMSQGSWLHADVTPELVFETDPAEMWEQALAQLGIDPESIVPGIGVH